jgi:hypothetical protein
MAVPQRPSPQFTPRRLARRPTITLFLAPHRVLLATAIDRCGRNTFPAEWTGEELLARSMIITPAGPQRRDIPAIPPSLTSGTKGHPAHTVWYVEEGGGIATYNSREEAEAVWEKEQEKIHDLYKSECAARARFNAVVLTIRGHLATGEWKAFIFDRTSGHEYPVPVTYWRSDGGGQAFELQDDIAKWRDPNSVCISVSGGGYNPSFRIRGNIILPVDCMPASVPVREHLPTRPLSEDESRNLFLSNSGPVRSPIDNCLYYTWEAYRDHLRDHSGSVIRPMAPGPEIGAEQSKAPQSTSTLAPENGGGPSEEDKAENQKAAASSIQAQSRCRRWLAEQMRQSPSPQKAKAGYRADAKTRFPGLSERAFDRAWAGAVEETGATEWAAPGRRQS